MPGERDAANAIVGLGLNRSSVLTIAPELKSGR
jgi:hypothetical protein